MKLIIFTFILSFVLSTKAVILDTDGNELKPNTEYYILPSATALCRRAHLRETTKNSSCAENVAEVWTLVSDTDTGKRFVKIGGVLGNPGNDTLANWFNIQEYMNGLYKLVYCPTVCETCKPACGYLGIVNDDDGGLWLAITDEPFACAFTKA
ncbi:miraculin-like [Dioscorea cayenensis subsp. rotundata]|uniref:Miraculin-like n=1 Tax=Dioscorea cayennensis subsp. rotundata TaxID=55577 RepID=A0AB40CVI9_DIOCR|nr:miraculin-like [Dioscorea cayenensis subsp. rotundata]